MFDPGYSMMLDYKRTAKPTVPGHFLNSHASHGSNSVKKISDSTKNRISKAPISLNPARSPGKTMITGWWFFATPLKIMEFVSWD